MAKQVAAFSNLFSVVERMLVWDPVRWKVRAC